MKAYICRVTFVNTTRTKTIKAQIAAFYNIYSGFCCIYNSCTVQRWVHFLTEYTWYLGQNTLVIFFTQSTFFRKVLFQRETYM